jgi:hypothetical protein
MKNTEKTLTCITFKGTTKLHEDHPFKPAKYIVECMKKGAPHVQIFIEEEGTRTNTSQ